MIEDRRVAEIRDTAPDRSPASGPRARVPQRGYARIEEILGSVDRALAEQFPGDRRAPQPIHTAYIGAADATVETPDRWGAAALALLEEHADTVAGLAPDVDLTAVRAALAGRPIRDLRLDFEDGYGFRGDAAEDRDAIAAGRTLAGLAAAPTAPTSLGIRAKGLGPVERARGFRTLELVLSAAGGVPPGFVFTVPKLRAAQQVHAVVALCEEIERAHGLPERSLRFELQIESPQAIVGPDGGATVARAIHLAAGRCRGLHYGTYDYSAACGIAGRYQSLDHPVADHAKAVMLAAAAQTGVWVCDGSTQVTPVGTDEQVRAALQRHFRLVTRALERGFYQGWDMHPGHLVTRYAATFAFFRAALEPAVTRLAAYLDRLGGPIVDEPATAEALAAVLLRGVDCGAFAEADVVAIAPACTVSVLRRVVARRPSM
ncbi:DUF6986 family protein [Tsukamurella soli]|uniref:Aldolase/citrate lyase family protein n=1 Tax=Tsukamurella soli TaxID=644556 RepID=A0ABP8JPJ6_9ACTN